MTAGELFNFILDIKNMKATELADKSGCSKTYLHAISYNKFIPSSEKLQKISDALGIDICLFLNCMYKGVPLDDKNKKIFALIEHIMKLKNELKELLDAK